MTEIPRTPPDALAGYAEARSGLAHRFRSTGILAIEGADRAAFLQGQLTQDVRGLGTGQARPAAGLTPKGKLLYFGWLAAETDRLLLLVPYDARSTVADHLAKYAVFQKVSVSDVSDRFLRLGLSGPGAAALATPAGALRLPPDGEFAVGLLASAQLLDELDRTLAAAGSVPLGAGAAEVLRIEAGRPLFGTDADGSNLPDEVGLASSISTTKGCYVGQEIVARQRTYGRVNRRLVGFRFPGGPVPAGTVYRDPEKPDLELGRVTSSVVSPRFGAIGLGFAFRDVPEEATLTRPEAPDRPARVGPIPFA